MLPAPPTNPFAGTDGFGYDALFIRNSQYVKPASFSRLGFDVVVRLRNPEGLLSYAKSLDRATTRASLQFMTPDQIADRYYATTTDYQKSIDYLKGQGLVVTSWPTRFMIHVAGTQAQLEKAFSTKLAWYRHGNEVYIAPSVAPSVPKGVPIVGSDNIVYRTKRYSPSVIHAASNGLLSGYSPQQIQRVFDYITAYTGGYTGSGINIGIIGTGPVSVQSGTRVGDLDAMRSTYKAIGSNPLTVVSNLAPPFAQPPAVTASSSTCSNDTGAGSSNPNLPPSESPTSSCNPEDVEAQIDTEQSALLAPGAQVQFYLDYEPSAGPSGYSAQGLALADDEINDALAANSADILSLSFGGDEYSLSQESPPPFNSSGTGVEQLLFAQAVSQGIAVFVSTGDLGANTCQDNPGSPQENDLCVSYPASDQNVVAVGGVTTPLNSAGQLTGPITAWGQSTSGGFGGTGGGVSNFIPQPPYQNGAVGVIGTQFRNLPDLSMEADPSTGVAVLINADPSLGGPQVLPVGGTSVAAPEMAAMWATVLNACKSRVSCPGAPSGPKPYRYGLPNPQLYLIYAGKGTQSYALTFYDVVYGNNGQQGQPSPGPTYDPGYSAGVGYDQTTGLGVPFARSLIRAIAGV